MEGEPTQTSAAEVLVVVPLGPVPLTLAAIAYFLYWQNTRTTRIPEPLHLLVSLLVSYTFYYVLLYAILNGSFRHWTRLRLVVVSSLMPVVALGVLSVVPGPPLDFFGRIGRLPASIYWNFPGMVVLEELRGIVLADPGSHSIWDASRRGLKARWLDFGMQSDGRLIALGTVYGLNESSTQIYRIGPDGERDGSFASRVVPGARLHVLPTGEMIAFSSHPPYRSRVVRAVLLGQDGELMRSVEAELPREYGLDIWVRWVAFEPTGRVVFGGRFGNHPLVAVTPEGRLDEELGSGPISSFALVAGLPRDAKGRFLTVEERYQPAYPAKRPGISAFGPDGRRDEDLMQAVASYGLGGASAVAVQGDDSFVVAFDTKTADGKYSSVLRRFSSAGQLDAGFEPPVIPWVNRLLVVSGGRLLAARIYDWQASVNAYRPHAMLVRIYPDGRLDRAFNEAAELSLDSVRLIYTVATGPADAVLLGADMRADNSYWMGSLVLTQDGTTDRRHRSLPATLGLSE